MSPSAAAPHETSPLLRPPIPAADASRPLNGDTPCAPEQNDAEQARDSHNSPDVPGHSRVARKAPPRMAVVFPAICMGTFLAAADGTMVLVSYATISSELDALNLASWIMTAYTLALASCQPLYGRLCDVFGRKQCLLAAYGFFASGCFACGLAQSIEQLILARVLQAVGAGGLSTVVSILLTALVPPEDRGIWQGVLNIVYSVGAGLGAPLGGLLAGSVGWRWSFFAQVPFCVLAILLVAACLDGDIGQTHQHEQSSDEYAAETETDTLLCKLRRVDFLGAGSLVVAISAFMFALDRGSNGSWLAAETWVPFVASVLAAVWFVHVESRVAREAIMPLAITMSPKLLPIYIPSFLCFFALSAMDFSLPLYYQVKDQLSPQEASLYMLPAIAAGVLGALAAGFWMRHTGQFYWAVNVGSAVQATGALMAFLLSGALCEFTAGLVLSQVVCELGVGLLIVSALIAVIAHSSHTNVAVVTAAYYAIRSLGAVLGVSTVSTVYQQVLRRVLLVELGRYDLDADSIIDEVRKDIGSLKTLDPQIAGIVRDCYGQALNKGFLLIFASVLVAAIPASRIRAAEIKK